MEKARKTKRLDNITFGQKRDPCEGFFGKLMTIFFTRRGAVNPPSETNAGVTVHLPTHGKTGLLETRTDEGVLKTVDRDTLEPVGVVNQSVLHPELTGPISCAHAQFDPINGDAFNFNLQCSRYATYKVFRTSAATGETDILATITGPDVPAAYLHAFFLTANYIVLCVWNSHYAGRGLKVLWTRNILDALNPFDPNIPTHWFVIDRKHGHGLVQRFTSHAMFAFHTVNAFETPNADGTSTDIACDVIEYPSLDILHHTYYANLVSNGATAAATAAQHSKAKASHLVRYTLPAVSAARPWQPLVDTARVADVTFRIPFNGDLPTHNPTRRTLPYRYVYGVHDEGKSSFYDSLIKLDLLGGGGTVRRCWSRARHTPSEAVFVVDEARRGREDGGWLLSCVLDGETGRSYLLCLDAESMEEVGRAESDVAWGIGFHGIMVADS
jgi:torulene dioxygenase